MLDPNLVEELRRTFRATGSAKLVDPAGRRIYLVDTRLLGETPAELLLAYEGQGSIVFSLDRPMNAFRLVSAGFSMRVAPQVAEIVNALCWAAPTGAKALSSPAKEVP